LHFHDIGHGWTVDPFGIDAKYAWEKIDESLVPTDMVQYLAEIDGKRGLFDGRPANTQFCMSNPKARKMFVDFVVKYAEDHSNIDYLHVWLADNVNNHCECSECCKKIPSDYYVVLMNDLDKALSAKRLDTKIVFIAYLDTIYPPELEKIENSSRFSLLIAPISRCYSVPNTIRWYAKSKCKTISSIGALDFFKAENAPEGATERCQDCPHKDTCPYSAYRIYIERWHQFGCPTHEWPYNVVTPEPVSEEKIRESIESGPYGRCVFHCDNNVVDHQTVQMLFENGITATFHMNAFNLHGGRRVTMFGTYGEVYMDEKTITLDVFGKPTEVISIDALLEADYGHGGGDLKLVEALYDMMEGNAGLETSLEASVESHLMGIKAEESRLAAGKLLLVHN